MTKGRTLVYTKDGDAYRGYFDSKSLAEWKKYGRKNGMKYLYKGYRYGTHFSGEGTETVCVFSNKSWDASELAKRKANRFLGIRKYVC